MSRARHKRTLKRQKQIRKRKRHVEMFFSWLADHVLDEGGVMTFPLDGGYTIEWTRPHRHLIDRRSTLETRRIDFPWPDHQIAAEGDSPNQTPDTDGVAFRELLP